MTMPNMSGSSTRSPPGIRLSLPSWLEPWRRGFPIPRSRSSGGWRFHSASPSKFKTTSSTLARRGTTTARILAATSGRENTLSFSSMLYARPLLTAGERLSTFCASRNQRPRIRMARRCATAPATPRTAAGQCFATRRVPETAKSEDEVAFLRALIDACGSIDYARVIALTYARRFERDLQRASKTWPPSIHKDFLHDLAKFTIDRTH